MPREPLDPEDLPKEALRQVAVGQLEDEVPGMPDQAAAGLEQPLLQARQRPTLNGKGGERADAGGCRFGPVSVVTMKPPPAAGPNEKVLDDGLPPGLGPLNDREEGLLPPVSTVNVAWPERGGQAVAVLVEDEERMIADVLEGTGVDRLLLRAVDRALGAVDIQDHPPRERAGRLMLHQVRIEASESLEGPLLREDVRFEPSAGWM
jgi:hypothetical protein